MLFKFIIIFILIIRILIIFIVLMRALLLIANIKQNAPRRESNLGPFSPGVFWRAGAPNNATPARQNFEAGTMPGKMPPMCRTFSEFSVKWPNKKFPFFFLVNLIYYLIYLFKINIKNYYFCYTKTNGKKK